MKRSFSTSAIPKLFLLIFILTSSLIQAGNPYLEVKKYNLKWFKQSQKETAYRNDAIFEGAQLDAFQEGIPTFVKSFPILSPYTSYEVQVIPISWDTVDAKLYPNILETIAVSKDISFEYKQAIAMGQGQLHVRIIPFSQADEKGKLRRLKSFEIHITANESELNQDLNELLFSDNKTKEAVNSVLNDGDIYKIAIQETGMHKLTAENLESLGVNISGLKTESIKLYGLRGGLLPEDERDFRYEDLQELPIEIVGDANQFNSNSYIIFYGESPTSWDRPAFYDYFSPQYNYASDYTYYFLKISQAKGKRISNSPVVTADASFTSSVFIDYQLHQVSLKNIIGSGRHFFGEEFDQNNKSRSFTFNFPNRVTDSLIYVDGLVGAENSKSTKFTTTVNGSTVANTNIGSVSKGSMKTGDIKTKFKNPTEKLKIDLYASLSSGSAKGYLQYLSVNAYRHLIYTDQQVAFRITENIGVDKITQYQIQSAQSPKIWNVTDPFNAQKISYDQSGNQINFKSNTEKEQHFIMFSDSDLKGVQPIGKIANQNLHALRNIDYLIIAYPDFVPQANRLADLHRNKKGLKVKVSTPQEIYNEFSSGSQDITAIRDFVRLLYLSSDPGEQIKYLLLFGDASYDYKGILGKTSNFVPTWEDPRTGTLNITSNIVTDDFYGILERADNEDGLEGSLDIGIGRFPVETLTEASNAVNKTERYMNADGLTYGSWRNMITMVADAGDGNQHISDAEAVAKSIETKFSRINLRKIYLGANTRTTTPIGIRSPETNKSINHAIEEGSLVVNYSGHGGEIGWSEKRILEISDINSWKNKDRLPLFITATCEFCRYDDPLRRSAGELVFLSEKGGAIALYTTARATYSGSNRALNIQVLDTLLACQNNDNMGIGYLLSIGKNNATQSISNNRVFVLIGDPALELAYPKQKAFITKINDKDILDKNDTLKALSKVKMSGNITNLSGNIDEQFNGEVFVKVTDKANTIKTKGIESSPKEFKLFNSFLYNGKSEVKNGAFNLTFVVPKDINYSFGDGRISIYAKSEDSDASGYSEDLIVGGFNSQANLESDGPEIQLYFNDESFKNGEMTDENPILIAKIFDENGINATGSGIGHNITAIIDGDLNNPYLLDTYYQTELNSFQKGHVRYPFSNLAEGKHTLSFKIWDVLNNSSTKNIDFEIKTNGEIELQNLYNFPNPLYNQTKFFFNHNQAGENLNVTINIYDISGRMIQQLESKIVSTGYSSEVMQWNGRRQDGYSAPNGVYPYQITVKSESTGKVTTKQSKLVIAR